VIGCWAALALALPLALPSLTEMSERNPVAILPADAPSTATARAITQTFRDAGSENVLVVLLTNDNGAPYLPDERCTAHWSTGCGRTRSTS
jgi:RND superfamily putative drug exporter